MKSTISCSKLLATAAVCGAVLAGCDSIKDVREAPYTAVPDETAVLGGTIRGLGSLRPLVLQNNGADTCLVLEDPNNPGGPRIVSECRFVGIPDEEYSTFSLGALPLGSAYNLTIKNQPFGKLCTIANPSGTIGQGSGNVQITCENDPALTLYTVTANISAAASAVPGLKVTLTTENGSCPVLATGLTSVTFEPSMCPNSATGFHENATFIFNNGLNLPGFGWRVTATIPGATAADPVTNCFVTGGPVANTGGNIDDEGKAIGPPTGDVTVDVVACSFTVRTQAVYSLPTVALTSAPTTSSPPAIPAGESIKVVLRSQPTGEEVAAARITSFANTFVPFMEIDGDGNPTAETYAARSHINAFFEVQVVESPTGMTCIPGGSVSSSSNVNASTGNRTVGNTTDGGAILLRRPASARVAQLWVPDVVIRCRLAPEAQRQLRGVYQQEEHTTRIASVDGGAPTTTYTAVKNRNYLALFENGMYMYGQHISGVSNNGVEQGFYHYVPEQQAIRFIPFTDTSGSSALHGTTTTSAGTVPLSRTIQDLQITSNANGRSVLRGTFTPWTNTTTTVNDVTTVADSLVEWVMVEAGADLLVETTNVMDGAWVQWDAARGVEDPRRVFVYLHGLYNAFHMGVNGMPNLQDACFVGDFGLVGSWTRQGARSGCNIRIYTQIGPSEGLGETDFRLLDSGSGDIPNPTAVMRDYPGRWPQSQNPSFTDGRPYSRVDYEIRLANSDPSDTVCPGADKLTVWDTAHGTRKSELSPPIPPIVLCRVTAAQ